MSDNPIHMPRASRMQGFDFNNINPELGATFVVEHLASGQAMGLGRPMSPGLAARVAATWRGRKKVIAS